MVVGTDECLDVRLVEASFDVFDHQARLADLRVSHHPDLSEYSTRTDQPFSTAAGEGMIAAPRTLITTEFFSSAAPAPDAPSPAAAPSLELPDVPEGPAVACEDDMTLLQNQRALRVPSPLRRKAGESNHLGVLTSS